MEKDEYYKINCGIELKCKDDSESKRSIKKNGESQYSNRSDAILNKDQKSLDRLKIEYKQVANNNHLRSSATDNKNDLTEINDKSDQNFINNSELKFSKLFSDKISKRYLDEKEKHQQEELGKKIKITKDKNFKNILWKIMSIAENISKHKVKLVDFIISFLILINVIFQIYENNHYTSTISENICGIDPSNSTRNPDPVNNTDCHLYYNIILKESYVIDSTVTFIRWFLIIIVIIVQFLLLYRYIVKVKILRSAYRACKSDNIFTVGLFPRYLFEAFIMVIFTPPGMTGIFSGQMLFGYYTYSYDSIITLFVILKLYYFFKLYPHLSIWGSERVVRIGVEKKISIGARFALKAQIKHTPYLMIIVMFSVCVGLFGFMLRIFEYGYSMDPGVILGAKVVKNLDFKSFTDTFWVIIITMMTVGYGDIYPSTHFGRFIAFLSALFGMLIVSSLIISLSYVVEFSSEEKKAHNLIKQMEANREMELLAGGLIRSIAKLHLIKNSEYFLNDSHNDKKHYMFMKQLMATRGFAGQFNRFKKVASTSTIPSDEMLSRLEIKLKQDCEDIGPDRLIMNDITDQTKRIIENEQEINHAVNYLKGRQDELTNYLVNFNKLKSESIVDNGDDYLITE